MKKFIFEIKGGIDCSWCVSMIKKILLKGFSIKKIEVDVLNSEIKMTLPEKIKPRSIVRYLDLRGYHLKELEAFK